MRMDGATVWHPESGTEDRAGASFETVSHRLVRMSWAATSAIERETDMCVHGLRAIRTLWHPPAMASRSPLAADCST